VTYPHEDLVNTLMKDYLLAPYLFGVGVLGLSASIKIACYA